MVVGLPCREAAMGGTQYTCRAAASASCNCHASISCSTPLPLPLPEFLLIISDGRRRSLVNHLGTPLLLSRSTQTQRAHVGLAFQRELKNSVDERGKTEDGREVDFAVLLGLYERGKVCTVRTGTEASRWPRPTISQGLPSVSIPAAKLTSPAS